MSLFLFHRVSAETVHDLYTSVVPVVSQALSLRSKALEQALEKVLIKVNGNAAVLEVPVVEEGLKHANELLQGYSYQTVTKKGPSSSSQSRTLQLKVSFDPESVQALLKQAAQTIWGEQRPLVILWLAAGDRATAHIVGSDSDSDLLVAIKQASAERGLPLLLPTLDLTDLQHMSAQDVWQLNTDIISQVSQRYGANADLAMRIVPIAESEEWQIDAELIFNNQRQHFQLTGDSPSELLAQLMNTVTDTLSQRTTVIEQDNVLSQRFAITVQDVKDVKAYAKVVNYLRALSPVKEVEVRNVEPKIIELVVTVQGGQEALNKALEMDQTLIPVQLVMAEDETDEHLFYHWNQS